MREIATLLLIILCLTRLSAASEAAVELYVAPNGNDAWSGRRAAPAKGGSDGPFATLERARDALRLLRSRGKAAGPATVWVRGGLYERSAGFVLEAQDGGAPGAPVAYRATRGEVVRLSGGRTVGGWKPVTDATVLARIPEEARSLVRVADLRAQGITDFGAMARRGFSGSGPACLELVYGDTAMTPARWPNEGWATIASAPAGPDGGKFAYQGDRPSRWTAAEDAWVHGYWMYDWADTYEKVASIDPAKREIATVPPHGVYGYGPGRRWYVLNLIEELDAAGEYWLDRKAGLLYCIPPAGKSGPAVVTMASEPLITLQGVRNVTLAGLILENGRGDGLHMRDCTDCVVAGCTLRNMGGSGMAVEGGSRCGARSCDLYGLGEAGVQLSGGDRQTLTPSGHFAENCHIHHHSRWCRTYRPAIGMQGVGARASHNLIEDGPHNAILLGGNDHIIEFNDISRVCTQTGDAGAVYMGRDWAMRGVVVRHNRFHDIGPTLSAGQEGRYTEVMAVYLDDCFSGGTITGNLFLRAGRAIMLGGGRDNTVENNVFIDCNPGVHIDQRAKGWAAEYMKPNGGWSIFENLKAVPYNRPPYDKYPHLATILEDDPPAAKYNRIVRNIHVGKGKWIDWLDGLNEKLVEVAGNTTEGDPGFVNAAAGDYRLKPGSAAAKAGFKPTLFHQAGLIRDAYRRTLPVPQPAGKE